SAVLRRGDPVWTRERVGRARPGTGFRGSRRPAGRGRPCRTRAADDIGRRLALSRWDQSSHLVRPAYLVRCSAPDLRFGVGRLVRPDRRVVRAICRSRREYLSDLRLPVPGGSVRGGRAPAPARQSPPGYSVVLAQHHVAPPLAIEHATFDIIDFLAAPRRKPARVAGHPASKRPRLAQVVLIGTAHRRRTVIRTALDHPFAPWQADNQHAVRKQRVE